MNEVVIRDWIKMLRSEKYQQCKGKLCSVVYDWDKHEETKKRAYCCLGVLEELHKSENKNIHKTRILDNVPENYYRYYENDDSKNNNDSCATMLLDVTKKWSGVSLKLQTELAHMNDSGKSFKEIADYLETKLEKSLRRKARRRIREKSKPKKPRRGKVT